jgi:hypothetical protein
MRTGIVVGPGDLLAHRGQYSRAARGFANLTGNAQEL